ncbi:MAG: potassium channel protein [Planctomycetaceae bacterium]|nr:potassium channel protein [Planctomycetaceae bacterium]
MQEDALYKRLLFSLGLFFSVLVLGAIGYWIIGLVYEPLPGTEESNYSFTFLNCLYMATITVSTVGYGEVVNYHELEPAGETVGVVYTVFYIIIAYLSVIYASANIVAALVEGAVGKIWQRRKMEKELQKLSGHYIVCGLGSTGRHVVNELVKSGKDVVAIERNAQNLSELSDGAVIKLHGDATEDEFITKARPEVAAGLFAVLPEDKDNLVITLTARQLNPNLRIVARATEFNSIAKLKKVGANVTISPNHIGGMRMASEMIRPSVTTFLDTMLRHSGAEMRFSEVRIEDGFKAAGKTIGELHTGDTCGLNVIGIFKKDQSIVYNPDGDARVDVGDAVIVISDPRGVEKLRHHLQVG